MPASISLIGQVFGRLTVIGKSSWREQGNVGWVCQCSCPAKNILIVPTGRIKSGNTKSCGCLNTLSRQQIGWANDVKRTTHGLATPGIIDRFYKRWHSIKDRCFNKNNTNYNNYGGRGITLYGPWINDPVAFVTYIKALPGSDNIKLSLDRINNNGNYEPGNLRWATLSQQMNNTRRSRKNKI